MLRIQLVIGANIVGPDSRRGGLRQRALTLQPLDPTKSRSHHAQNPAATAYNAFIPTMSMSHTTDTLTFNKPRHIKYWLRCLKTHLPTAYQANDSTRMTLACFTISALDLLGALETSTSADERAAYIDWIYRCQHPNGGFRGFTGADPGRLRSERNECWDPANLAATFFALATLIMLGNDLKRVKKRGCLRWLRSLQLEDGSFGEANGEYGKVSGGGDVRFGYCAASVRWVLSRVSDADAVGQEEDINVEALAKSITSLQVGDLSLRLVGWS